ncbi:MAG: nucleoside triphosphate pyrophosphatase [Alphaproteobacteria bacterium]
MTDNALASGVPVILASASRSRAAVLSNAGVRIEQDPADIDEDSIKESMRGAGRSVADVAHRLAELKALRVSARHPGRLVIGADQMLQCGGMWFDKPVDRNHALGHLRALRGRMHELFAAVCVVRDGECLWRHLESARMTMRPFSDAFLEAYVDAVGEDVCRSVGAYQLEGLGAQLFARIEGDFFTILGLPLLAVLEFLSNHGVVKK